MNREYVGMKEFNLYNFFAKEDEKGMTTTSANKLANLAKERNREDLLFVESVRFYSDVMTLMVNPSEKVTLREGFEGSPEMMQRIKASLLRVARFNAFISWVREAITAKEKLISEVKFTSMQKWCDDRDIVIPQRPDESIDEALYENRPTADVGIDGMAKYFMAEAKASVIGKAVHPDGALDVARRNLIDAQLNPSVREGAGQETVIITKIPTATTQIVNDFYMGIQADWRQAESEVNAYKSDWERKTNELKIELMNDLSAKMRYYESEFARISSDYENWKLEEIKRLGELKIHIPSLLQPVLDELLALGK